MQITPAQLLELLSTARTTPATIVTRTPVKMRKSLEGRANPYLKRGLVKIAERAGFIGGAYASQVNRQRGREGRPLDQDGNLELFYSESFWSGRGRHVNAHVATHTIKKTLYLKFRPTRAARYEYETERRREGERGRKINPELVLPWLYRDPDRDATSSRQLVENQIPWRTILIAHLVSLRFNGTLYELTHPEPVAA